MRVKQFTIVLILTILLTGSVFAQFTTIKLPTDTNTSGFYIEKLSGGLPLLKIQGDGGFYLNGTYGTGIIPIVGPGARLMWYPGKSAFRAGSVGGTQWDDASIGNYSVAHGKNVTASGDYSFASGESTAASGEFSTAFGTSTIASGIMSTAMGFNTLAVGTQSTTIGEMTYASGQASFAVGRAARAEGDYTVAIGDRTTVKSYFSLALGRYNIGNGTRDSWVATDPIFEIGIGADGNNKANAVTVLKNGHVGIGATTPNAKLEIASDDRWNSLILKSDPNSVADQPGIYFHRTAGTNWNIFTNDWLHFYCETSGKEHYAMSLTEDGKILIGEGIFPDERLHVMGNVKADKYYATSDIEITDKTKGIIMTTPDGTKKFRITIDNSGNLVSTQL